MSKLSKIAAVLALALILLSGSAAAGGLYARFQQTNANRKDNAAIWHAVICDIEQSLILDDKTLTRTQKIDYLAYYDRLLVNKAHAAPCRFQVTGR